VRVLVTGGAGFIGCNLVRRLMVAGHSVTVLDDLSTGSRSNLTSVDVPIVESSMLDLDILTKLTQATDSVVHLAALPSVPRSVANPFATHQANATGTLRVLTAARDADCHVIIASSSSVYGRNLALPKAETLRAQPMSPYAVSKLAAEQYALAFAECYGMDVLAFRFFNVFGPWQASEHAYAAVVPKLAAAALRGDALPIDGDGKQSRDFTFVGSLVSVLCQAVEQRITSADPVNLAFGGRTTLLDLVKILGELMDCELKVDHRAARTGDVRHSQADTEQLARLFPGLVPTPLKDGLAQTLDWMRTVLAP
jgi:UDP-glucose 4-epimerase